MATQALQVYKCLVCGIVVEVLDGGAGEPVCCGQPMALQAERTDAPHAEAHRLRLRQGPDGWTVTIGDVEHPMQPAHHIQWVEWIGDESACRRFLRPGQRARAVFPPSPPPKAVRAFCNRHGLWRL